MTDDRIRELLREIRDQPVPADSLARVRARVEARTARRGRWWLVPVFAAGLAVLLAMVFWPHHLEQPVRVARDEAPVIAPTSPAPKPVAAAVAKPTRVSAKRHPQPAAAVSTIRIETADPNVVLIFVNGGGED